MLQLYENIKRYRKEAGLTQEELAKLTGYSDRSSIAKVEKGAVDLSQSKIKQFAEVLGVTPGHLMGWDDKEPEDLGAIAAEVLQEPALLSMVQDYLTLSEKDKFMVRTLVESLAAKTKKD